MPIGAVSATETTKPTNNTEAAMLRALGNILRRGAILIEDVETLAAVVGNLSTDEAARCFAGRSLRWLAGQTAMTTTPIWKPHADARN